MTTLVAGNKDLIRVLSAVVSVIASVLIDFTQL